MDEGTTPLILGAGCSVDESHRLANQMSDALATFAERLGEESELLHQVTQDALELMDMPGAPTVDSAKATPTNLSTIFCCEGRQPAMPDDSPCDSPIEDIFYWDIQKRLSIEAVITRQCACQTHIGTFFLDFLIEYNARRVAFECDGREFHESARDSVRDRAIVHAGHADCIYRLRGYDICFHLYDALDLIRARERSLFSERGHRNIERLASRRQEHRDLFGALADGFPFVAVRSYERERDDGDVYADDVLDDDADAQKFKRATVVCWTGY